MRIFNLTVIVASIILFTSSIVTGVTSPSGGGGGGQATSGDWWLLAIFIIVTIVFSFLCSVAESALLNITPSFIADLQDKNPKLAEKVIDARQKNIDKSLAAILTMNTLAHTVGAIGSGAIAQRIFGSVMITVFSILMTLAILYISEIIPKTIGVVFWKQLIGPVIRYIDILNLLLYPAIWVALSLTKLIAKDKEAHAFNRDEFVAMASVGLASGALTDRESRIIQNLFQLGSLTAKDVYTPRTVMMAFDQNLTVSDVYKVNDQLNFSRLLIYDGDLDNITGFVLKDELLVLESEDQGNTKLHKILREIMAIPINTSLSKVLEIFLQNKQHIAIVVDEFGTKGLITVEDVLETLLGIEIVDESDSVPDMQELAKQLWKKRMASFGIAIPEEADPFSNGVEDSDNKAEVEEESN